MLHGKEGAHPSQPDSFLLYNAVRDVDFDVEDLVGDFGWFYHGKHLAVDLSIGLHCLDDDLWEELP
ncbi:MAG: hypothetical protein SV186_00155 [Candidatus Nanohaloarchaea archaeon]|nr:hypothetical protein [Candidatus Nanohaloarchaea archaeon]